MSWRRSAAQRIEARTAERRQIAIGSCLTENAEASASARIQGAINDSAHTLPLASLMTTSTGELVEASVAVGFLATVLLYML